MEENILETRENSLAALRAKKEELEILEAKDYSLSEELMEIMAKDEKK